MANIKKSKMLDAAQKTHLSWWPKLLFWSFNMLKRFLLLTCKTKYLLEFEIHKKMPNEAQKIADMKILLHNIYQILFPPLLWYSDIYKPHETWTLLVLISDQLCLDIICLICGINLYHYKNMWVQWSTAFSSLDLMSSLI